MWQLGNYELLSQNFCKYMEKKPEKYITISSFHYRPLELITFPQKSGPNTH